MKPAHWRGWSAREARYASLSAYSGPFSPHRPRNPRSRSGSPVPSARTQGTRGHGAAYGPRNMPERPHGTVRHPPHPSPSPWRGRTGSPCGRHPSSLAGDPVGRSVDRIPRTEVAGMPLRQHIGGLGSQIQRPERQRTAVLLAYERAELRQACRLRSEQYGASPGAAGADVVRPVR